MKYSVEFKNFKKIEDLTAEFEGGNIYIIGGPNEIGKSTFLQGIEILSTGVDPNKGSIVTDGKEEGHIKTEFIGADGSKYVVKYNFNDNKNQFILINPKTEVKKSTSRNNVIAEIFKYNKFTIEEWFAWGLTAEGRRKQADIILNLLPEKAKEEYLSIDDKISPKVGVIFGQRTSLNKDYDILKKTVEEYELSKLDIEDINKKTSVDTLLPTLKQELEKALKNNPDSIKKNIEFLNASISEKEVASNEKVVSLEEQDRELEKECEELLKQIELKKKKRAEIKEQITITKSTSQEEIKKITEEVKALEESVKTLTDGVDIEKLKERIATGEALQNKINNLIDKQKTYNEKCTKLQELFENIEKLNNEIDNLKERKVQILTENKLPISNIIIEDGEALYVDKEGVKLPFIRESVSYSSGGMIVLELMAHINKELPIWLVGSAESYDKSRMEKLRILAKKYNGIVLLDKVIDNEKQQLEITCVEI